MTKNKNSIIILMVLICAAGIATAYKFYQFAQDDPSYCAMCHLTTEGYNSHESSVHYELKCQTCHIMSTIEGNKLIMAHYIKGEKSVEQSHGRKKPWEICIDCHNSHARQGSVTFRKSYGHARHVFMHDINCRACHSGQLHDLSVSAEKCRKCHTDKLVHGMGTAGLYCLNCHNFRENAKEMQPSTKCSKCHPNLKTSEIMSSLECHDCHKPHKKLQLKSSDCLGSCHSSETKVGQHSLHLKLGKLECIDCHRPHEWEVTKKNAKGLCDKCHKLKDPMTFIY